jgi:23S rRNA (cytidine1920-2'-O)/16S rRNA (cytidine1409-2'-O)-methyltransferase
LIFMPGLWKEARVTTSRTPPPDPAPRAKPATKQRVDQLLVERGLAESRARAQALILAGLVFVGEAKVAKAGQTVPADAAIEVRGRDHPWVSRGGIKLAHAIDHFGLDPAGVVAMDIGSSTGGFTDVLLQRGPPMSLRWIRAPISWPGSCARIRVSPFWSKPARAS